MDPFDEFTVPNIANFGSVPPEMLSLLGLAPLDPRVNEFLNALPSLSEKDLVSTGQKDDLCPICFVSFLAILAEEEMAQAMDSPTHSVSDLGVTRLTDTCRHIFCRKDITKWVHEGRDSCPTCRTPFLPATNLPAPASTPTPTPPTNSLNSAEGQMQPPSPGGSTPADSNSPPSISDEELRELLPGLSEPERRSLLAQMNPVFSAFSQMGRTPPRRDDDRNEFAGMYS